LTEVEQKAFTFYLSNSILYTLSDLFETIFHPIVSVSRTDYLKSLVGPEKNLPVRTGGPTVLANPVVLKGT
jgi:hypothetical protein